MMIKLAGCIMIISGCAGMANAWCTEQKRRLVMLRQIRKIYEDMKYYITYQKTTIPEALHRISGNKELFLADAFNEIYEEQKKGEKTSLKIGKGRWRGHWHKLHCAVRREGFCWTSLPVWGL